MSSLDLRITIMFLSVRVVRSCSRSFAEQLVCFLPVAAVMAAVWQRSGSLRY